MDRDVVPQIPVIKEIKTMNRRNVSAPLLASVAIVERNPLCSIVARYG